MHPHCSTRRPFTLLPVSLRAYGIVATNHAFLDNHLVIRYVVATAII